MSQSFPPPSEQGEPSTPGLRKRVRFTRLVPRRRGTRLAALGAAVIIVGAGAAAVTVADHHRGEHEQRGGQPTAAGRADGGHTKNHGESHGENRAQGHGKGHGEGHEKGHGENASHENGSNGGPGPALAAAPLPALPAAQAADKAAAAVPGGKVESLQVVGQQGGGSAWLAVVVGPDGVRHQVTLSGADGTPTSNIVTVPTTVGGPAVIR
ncbi:hypothetical protein [Kitasatospora sp. McL0602]|uniref:hypothetical protein n=1 Tax=Kitasatospora sp. McL0602 TaxID=3439530 RepID=UPI003F88C8B8